MIEAPVFHVNGDDPEAVAMVARIALDYRMKFHKDVVIDMVCFRRLGHNEQDEPFVTQPLMYKKIAQHPGTRKLYADKLEREGVVRRRIRRPAGDERSHRARRGQAHQSRRSSTACARRSPWTGRPTWAWNGGARPTPPCRWRS